MLSHFCDAQNTCVTREPGPRVCLPLFVDESPPLGEIHPLIIVKKGPRQIHEVRRLRILGAKGPSADPLVQQSATQELPLVVDGFEGIGKGLKYEPSDSPPDTTGAAGKGFFIEWVNQVFGIFQKSQPHKMVYGPAQGNTLWTGFAARETAQPQVRARACATTNDGDPIVLYDRISDRWMLSQLSSSSGHYLQCVAVSKTQDPLGPYRRYAYEFDSFNDYGKFGIWPDGYYASFNLFDSSSKQSSPKGVAVCAFDRAAMLDGKPAKAICVSLPNYQGLLPADLEGSTPPPASPAGRSEYFINLGLNKLNLWTFHVDWQTLTKSQLTGPIDIVGVKAFNVACNPPPDPQGCNFVAQKGANVLLDSMGDRPMYRLSYRNFGSYESLLVHHAVQISGPENNGKGVTGFRWYEIRKSGSTIKVDKSGTYRPDENSRWMSSMGLDKEENLLVCYSTSGVNTFPGARCSGRSVHDASDQHGLDKEVVLTTGTGAQPTSHWGDYSTMTMDPEDNCTFWFVSEYLTKTDADAWHTYVNLMKFKSCQ
jgi:hypothetical protein